MISAIVAVDEEWGIGYQGQLLEHLPPDMKYFREITENHIVIMGRKTWDSLSHKPLSKRHNIIISSTLAPKSEFYCETHYLQIISLKNLNEGTIRGFDEDIFIIGGGEIYKQLLPYCDRVYITKIFKHHKNVDTFFPNLDINPDWRVSESSELKQYNNIFYQFITYERV